MIKTKVAFFAFSLKQAGGRERQVVSLIKALAHNEKHEIELVLSDKLVFYNEVFSLPIKISYINTNNKNLIRNYSFYYKHLIKSKPDIIHACDEYVAFYLLPIAWLLNIPFINASLRHGRVRFHLRHLIRKFTYKFSPHIIANSYAGLHANGLSPNEKRIVIYNVVDDALLLKKESSQNASGSIDQHTKNNPCYTFLSISRLHKVKDYETVFKALSWLKKSIDFNYIIVGDGPNKQQLEKQIIQYDLTDKVTLVGENKDVVKFYKMCDVFIHSSYSEGCPNVVLEAMLLSRPVIATNTGGTKEIIKNGENGVLFPLKNAKVLYEKLLQLVSSSNLRAELRGRARVYVEQNHNAKTIGDSYIAFLHKVIRKTDK